MNENKEFEENEKMIKQCELLKPLGRQEFNINSNLHFVIEIDKYEDSDNFILSICSTLVELKNSINTEQSFEVTRNDLINFMYSIQTALE